jgi:phenylalanyl-tRNA synthetase beta chain
MATTPYLRLRPRTRSACVRTARRFAPFAAIKRLLVDRGWQEAVTFSFVSSSSEAKLFPARDARAAPIRVENPIAGHLDVMRTTLAGSLLEVLRNNLARKLERVRIFETGRIYLRADGRYEQPLQLGGLAYGPVRPSSGVTKRGRWTSST